ncbi:MAG: hypothetical protein JRG91_20355 [Deltaproteobacteria bacterium]|nr:hypothetical protein [Deltaproteobacteria bacterium]
MPESAEAGDLLLSKALQGESKEGYWIPGKTRMASHYRGRGKGLLIAGSVVLTGASILGITAIASIAHYHTVEAPEDYYEDSDPGLFGYGAEWLFLASIMGPIALVHTVVALALLFAGSVNRTKARRLEALVQGTYPLPVLAMNPDGSGGTVGVFFRF